MKSESNGVASIGVSPANSHISVLSIVGPEMVTLQLSLVYCIPFPITNLLNASKVVSAGGSPLQA